MLYFVSLAAKLTAGIEGLVRTLAIKCVFLFLFFFPFLVNRFSIFHDQTHTRTKTRKVRSDAERPKGDKEIYNDAVY